MRGPGCPGGDQAFAPPGVEELLDLLEPLDLDPEPDLEPDLEPDPVRGQLRRLERGVTRLLLLRGDPPAPVRALGGLGGGAGGTGRG